MRFLAPIPLSEIIGRAAHLAVSPAQRDSALCSTQPILALDAPPFSTRESLTFIRKETSAVSLKNLEAAFVISEQPLQLSSPGSFQVTNVYEAIRLIAEFCRPRFVRAAAGQSEGDVHPSAVVEGTTGPGARVGAGCFVGAGSVIGAGTVLEPNVTVQENCTIGADCLIQSGSVIGSAGFGFYEFEGQVRHMPHYAGVIIGSRVWVGANTVIAAGVLNPTLIGNGCKLDSHLQVAHNVVLGEGGMIASQSGIAGSTRIGKGLRMGGASSIAGHLVLGDNVTIAARSGVTKHIEDGAVIAGYPAQPLKDWKAQKILMKQMLKRQEGYSGQD